MITQKLRNSNRNVHISHVFVNIDMSVQFLFKDIFQPLEFEATRTKASLTQGDANWASSE